MEEKSVVMKFGGAALAEPSSIVRVATCIKVKRASHEQVVVVVSAMGDMTDRLLSLARTVSPQDHVREQDMLLSVGERISMALLAMALRDLKVEAVSLTGSQSGIITSRNHVNAGIKRINPTRIVEALSLGKTAIVAGFQGVSEEREITTLGRGGSDTTAVALGVALRAERVEFYKDVPGFFPYDPKKEPTPRKRKTPSPQLSFQEAITLAEQGCSPLHIRALRLAAKNRIPLHVLSFREEERRLHAGTHITSGTHTPHTGVEPTYETL
ncbi:MAG: aspartate kinase [Simkaniaceae bacterium]|nr:aspartate kinase [Simkaniaceae bacterium]